VGYFEEEAIHSYEHYAHLIATGVHENIQATRLAQEYWGLSSTAKLSDVVEATIKDEMLHRDVNHRFADNKRASVWN
jgi:ubiquinol oxidase